MQTQDDIEVNLFYCRLSVVRQLRRSRKKRDQADARLLLDVAKAAMVMHARRYTLTAGDH